MPTQHKHRFAVLGLSVLSLALLAGCAGLDDSDAQTTGKNRDPEAVINADDKVVDTGDAVTFDAVGSEDEDGRIVSYSYSFGDGTTAEATDDDESIEHVYAHGGEFIVTLTVTDDGNDGAGSGTDQAAVEITVNQEFVIASQVVTADVVDDADEMNSTFDVYESADRFELDLDVTGTLVTGSSEIEIRVTDADGDEVPGASQTVNVDGTETKHVDINGILTETGAHHVEVVAKSGAASVAGTLMVYYGAEEA